MGTRSRTNRLRTIKTHGRADCFTLRMLRTPDRYGDTMRAIRCNQYGPPESLVVENLPDLEPPPGHVVIDVKAAAVNFPDVLIIENKYQFKPPCPLRPARKSRASCARSVPVSRSSSRARAWSRSPARAALPSRRWRRSAACVPLADGVDFELAAAFTLAYGTSHHAVVDRGQLKAGETMLGVGCGRWRRARRRSKSARRSARA